MPRPELAAFAARRRKIELIFFADHDGTIVKCLPGAVHQGSANADEIALFAPFACNTQVMAAFRLADGSTLAPSAMAPAGRVATKEGGAVWSGWTYTVPAAVAARYGTVAVQFYFYTESEGEVTASGEATFAVSRGVRAQLPETPSADVYGQILSNIAALSGEVAGGFYPSRALYAWSNAYTYGANELAFVPDGEGYGVLLRSKVADNDHAPYADGALQTDYWEVMLSFGAAHSASEQAQAFAENAGASAQAASVSEAAAQAAASAAEEDKATAQAFKDEAQGFSLSAQSAAQDAETARFAAVSAEASAEGYAAEAQASVQLAKRYAELGIQPNTDYTDAKDLPVPGSTKFLYLIPNAQSGAAEDSYNEYIWVPSKSAYEFIGSTRIDLSDYAHKSGSYPDMTVGGAETAVNAQNAVNAENAQNALTAGTAEKLANALTFGEKSFNGSAAQTVTKSDLGLGNVENTSDADKPVSAAVQAALGQKANVSGNYPGLSVGSATKADQDGNGENIASVYARQNGTYGSMSVGNATNAENAVKAAQDGNGDNIAAVYLKAAALLDKTYPVGAVYISLQGTSPASLFGGSWTQIQNRFLYAQGTYGAGATGGEETHVLSVSEMPSHNHGVPVIEAGNAGGGYNHIQYDGWYTNNANTLTTQYTGSGAAHNNMPPYYVVYMWRRTA